MEALGTIKMKGKNRLTMPMEVVNALDLREGDIILIFREDDGTVTLQIIKGHRPVKKDQSKTAK